MKTFFGSCFLLVLTSSMLFAGDDSLNFDDVIGLRVDVENSANCGGSNSTTQTVTDSGSISGGGERRCPIKIAVTVTGKVETQDAPFDYVYVNDVLFFSGNDSDGECAMTTKTETKVVTVEPDEDVVVLSYDTSDGLYHTGAYATITNVELVEEGCSSGCEAGGGNLDNGSIHASFNLGKGAYGQSLGALRIEEILPSAILGTPASLRYSAAWPGVVVNRDINNAIRQVKTPQCLADVVTESATKFRIDFYNTANIGPLTGGLYNQSGKVPYVSWIIENVNPANNGNLKITQSRGTTNIVNEFLWDASVQAWELIEGDGLRKEKKSVVADSANGTRTVTEEVRDISNVLVSKSSKKYKEYAWGRELIQEVLDPDGAALTTNYAYYENEIVDGGGYKKIKSIIRPDGGWILYQYDSSGREVKTIEPFLDSPFGSSENVCKVVSTIYQNSSPQETQITKIQGQEVARSYKVNSNSYDHITSHVTCTIAGASYSDPSNLVTTTKLLAQGDFTGEVEWVSYPDGTITAYEYSKNSNYKTVVSQTGVKVNNIFVSGKKSTTVMDVSGNLVSEMVVDIASQLTLSFETVTASDVFGRPTTIDYNDGTFETISYGCCGVTSRISRDGIVTTYTYDNFKRLLSESKAGITIAYTYDCEGRVLTKKRIGSDNSQIVQETNTYDVSGRLVSTKDALLNQTTYAWSFDSFGRNVETVTNPDGGVKNTTSHKDGRIYAISGSAVGVYSKRWSYGVDSVGYFEREINATAEMSTPTEWTQSWQDIAGRVIRSQQNGLTSSYRFYNIQGKLERTIDPDGVITLYDDTDAISKVILDVDRNQAESVSDKVEIVKKQVVSANGTVVNRVQRSVVNTSGAEELISQVDTTTDNRRSWVYVLGQTTSSVTTYLIGGSRTETITKPDGSQQIYNYSQNGLISEASYAAGGSLLLKSVSYTYDSHGRLLSATDARTGAVNYTYDSMDRFLTVSKAPQVTAYTYDSMGRVLTKANGGNQITNTWNQDGTLRKWTDYHGYEEYSYGLQGRIGALSKNYQTTTFWNYDGQTGRLSSKKDAQANYILYTYTQAGRLLTRAVNGGVTRTYSYDQGGRQTGISYSDNTPSVTYGLNRLSQITSITDASGGRSRALTIDGRLVSETYQSGLLAGESISYGYDSLLRQNTFSVGTGSSPLQTTWTYDGASRLQTVTSGAETASYTYHANSSLVSSRTITYGGVTALTTDISYNSYDRPSSINSASNGVVVSSRAYSFTDGQRIAVATQENGSKWQYGYDIRKQISTAQKLTSTNTLIPGMDFSNFVSASGNRSWTTNGMQSNATYNSDDQLKQKAVPSFIEIRGSALPSSTVTVNNQSTQRLDDYFYTALSVSNTTSAQYPQVSILAVANNLGPTGEDVVRESVRNHFLPKTPEVFAYDVEGNLVSDGRWSYTWDGENRLIKMETLSNIPVAAKRKLEFAYDAEWRRIRKQVFNWNGSAWVLQNDNRYLYDGWNMVAELNASNVVQRNFIWGIDLSGSLQGAGGVGGLLAIREGAESYLPCYDGNGNVITVIKASDRTVAARYEYGPYGEPLQVTENGVSNPFRFSTKFTDQETGLLYYGYRYYQPMNGRWISRDPLFSKPFLAPYTSRFPILEQLTEESSSRAKRNLYGFLDNNSVNSTDLLGLYEVTFKVVTKIRRAHGVLVPSAAIGIKTTHTMVIETDTGKVVRRDDSTGRTFGFVPASSGFHEDAWKVSSGGKCLVKATMTGWAKNWANPFLGSINYDLKLEMDLNAIPQTLKLTGEHDGFPSYEVKYDYGFYDFDETTEDKLDDPMDITVNESRP